MDSPKTLYPPKYITVKGHMIDNYFLSPSGKFFMLHGWDMVRTTDDIYLTIVQIEENFWSCIKSSIDD